MKKANLRSLLISQIIYIVLLPLLINLFQYLHPIVYAVIWCCLTAVVFLLVFWFENEKIWISKEIFVVGLVLYTISLFVLLFIRPNDQHNYSYNVVPFKTILFYLSGEVNPLIAIYNLVANVGLFIPYGIAFFLLNKSGRPSNGLLIVVPIFSIVLIESIQLVTLRGSLDVDDLILNLSGVGIGYALFPLISKLVKIT